MIISFYLYRGDFLAGKVSLLFALRKLLPLSLPLRSLPHPYYRGGEESPGFNSPSGRGGTRWLDPKQVELSSFADNRVPRVVAISDVSILQGVVHITGGFLSPGYLSILIESRSKYPCGQPCENPKITHAYVFS